MIRGTTPTHIFIIPFEVALIANLRLSYAQGENLILVKKIEDAELSGNTVSVTLTQEDTLKFDCSKRAVKIELKVATKDGKVCSSGVLTTRIDECINEEVL